MSYRGFSHIALSTLDLGKAREFYDARRSLRGTIGSRQAQTLNYRGSAMASPGQNYNSQLRCQSYDDRTKRWRHSAEYFTRHIRRELCRRLRCVSDLHFHR